MPPPFRGPARGAARPRVRPGGSGPESGDYMAIAGGSSETGQKVDAAAHRITALVEAFQAFAVRLPELTVEVVGHVAHEGSFVHPVAGFHVLLSGESGTGVSLYVSASYAELVRWRPGGGALRERFDVSFDEPGYRWGDSLFVTADDLVQALVGYMQFNLDALRKG
jgi:hypothetical protein